VDSTGHVFANMKLKGAALLMILSVKPVDKKKGQSKQKERNLLIMPLKTNLNQTLISKLKIHNDGSFSTLNSHKEC